MEITERQRIWDFCLLNGWHKFHPIKTAVHIYMCHVFGDESSNPVESLASLKRVPRYWKQGVRSAVACEMAWLSRQLWAEKRTDEELISMMTDAEYDLEKETRDRSAPTNREIKANVTKSALDHSIRKASNRGNQWKTSKPVRSK